MMVAESARAKGRFLVRVKHAIIERLCPCWVKRNREGTHCGVGGALMGGLSPGEAFADWSVLLETTSR